MQLHFEMSMATQFLVQLLNIPSPTGYHAEAIAFCRDAFAALDLPGFEINTTRRGALMMHWRGEGSAQVGITAHADTLGLMVKEIKANGCLKTAPLGGIIYNGIETENVTVRTRDNRRYRGTVLLMNPAAHVNNALTETKRNADTMEVRLDVKTSSAAETRALGIEVGDFIFVDPRVEMIDTGFIRGRFLDNKAGVACIYAALAALKAAHAKPANDTYIMISNYEEVGHGGAPDWSPQLEEYLCVDMAAIGDGQNSDEFSCTICTKDSGGPYHFDMIEKLCGLARENGIAHKTDLYPYYSSDGSAYWRAGGSARVGLIGPGVSGSHAYERTHIDSLLHSTHLIARYMLAAV
jgi:putative aminopeptidase FrvX